MAAAADMDRFATGRLSALDLAAHTEIAGMGGGRWVIAGASPGSWDGKNWQTLIGK